MRPPGLHERIEVTYIVAGPEGVDPSMCYRAAMVREDETEIAVAHGRTPFAAVLELMLCEESGRGPQKG
jgi:hypothetical protein